MLSAQCLMDISRQTLMITGFVLVMMLLVEFLNVLTRGVWYNWLASSRWSQYALAAFLGAIPGCLGAFAAVAMYSHRLLTLGALVAAMVATSGDEAFVMLSLFPGKALLLFAGLFVGGISLGAVTDRIYRRRSRDESVLKDDERFDLHVEDDCEYLPNGKFLKQWRECSPARGVMAGALGLFVVGLLTGQIGENGWDWTRVTLVVTGATALAIVAIVPDHFLEEHLWKHVVLGHLPGLLLWTFSALTVMHLIFDWLHLDPALQSGRWILLAVGLLMGLIPESGPHMVFTVLFAQGSLPISVLVANSIVQDGHGMLPVLAHSRRIFFKIKAIKLAAAAILGATAMALGY